MISIGCPLKEITSGYYVYYTNSTPRTAFSDPVTESDKIPETYSLYPCYPNPFNPSTKIKFEIPAVGQRHAFDAQLTIYDILGREVTTLVNEQLQPGSYSVEWDASNFASGIYFYKLVVGDRREIGASNTNNGGEGFSQSRKMVLIK